MIWHQAVSPNIAIGKKILFPFVEKKGIIFIFTEKILRANSMIINMVEVPGL